MDHQIACVDHVWVRYGDVVALEDIHFCLHPLDFVSIIGPNGGGKSTFLKVLLGLITPNQGTVQIFGQPPAQSRQELGYVPQQITHDKHFPVSVLDVALMGRLGRKPLFGNYTKEDRERADAALQKVKMESMQHRQIGRLSGGQQQRVLIARALVTNPKLLLLDEPTASVDQEMKRDIYELLIELNAQMTIVIVSHDIGAVSSYTKTIACLNRKLIYHEEKGVTTEMLSETYHCPVDLIAHGVPHRVFAPHE